MLNIINIVPVCKGNLNHYSAFKHVIDYLCTSPLDMLYLFKNDSFIPKVDFVHLDFIAHPRDFFGLS